MKNESIVHSKRTCFVYTQNGELVGKIQFQKEPIFNLWRIKYLSDTLPIHSGDVPAEVQEKLESANLTWRWGKLTHYYKSELGIAHASR